MGIRQQDRSFRISVQVSKELPVEAEAGLLYLYNDDNYVKLLMGIQKEGSCVSLIKREKGQEQLLLRKALDSFEEKDWIRLEISGEDQQISFSVQGEPLAAKVGAGFMSAERAGGFIGCTYGIYAEGSGGGYASFRNLTVEQQELS